VSLISTDDVTRYGAGGGLADADLQIVIDAEEAELVRRFGAHSGSRAETLHGGGRSIYVRRPIASITSIVEYLYLGDAAPITLATADYYAWADEGRIERLYGVYPGPAIWGPRVVVTYTPSTADLTLRKQVLIELVRIGVSQDTGASVSGLGYSISGGPKDSQAWRSARESLYSRLGAGDR
jgi:hypothetical protein